MFDRCHKRFQPDAVGLWGGGGGGGECVEPVSECYLVLAWRLGEQRTGTCLCVCMCVAECCIYLFFWFFLILFFSVAFSCLFSLILYFYCFCVFVLGGIFFCFSVHSFFSDFFSFSPIYLFIYSYIDITST